MSDERLDRAIALIRDWWSNNNEMAKKHQWPGHPHWFEAAVREWHDRSRRYGELLEKHVALYRAYKEMKKKHDNA